MKTVEFEINTQTGDLSAHIKGIVGPACDQISEQISDLIGEPTTSQKLPEYNQKVQEVQVVRS